MNKAIGTAFDKILQRVKYRSVKAGSPLSYNVMNPLANIRLAIEMVEAKNTDPDIKLYIEIIKRNCGIINQLIHDVLPKELPFILQENNSGAVKTLVSQDY